MTKFLFALLFLLSFGFKAISQDKIITNNSDTIDCKIVQLNKKEIVFQMSTKGIVTNGILPRSKVLAYQLSDNTIQLLLSTNSSAKKKGKNANKDVSNVLQQDSAIDTNSLKKLPIKKQPPFSFNLYSGYGYIIASTKDAIYKLTNYGYDFAPAKSYYDKLKHNWRTGASLHYTPFQYRLYALGFGLAFVNQTSSSSITGRINTGDGMHWKYGTHSETIYANLYAFSLRHNFFLDKEKHFTIYEESGMGLSTYRNEFLFAYSPMLLKAYSTGYYSKTGLDIELCRWLSFNVNAGYFLSMFNTFTANNGYSTQQMILPKGQYESLAKPTVEAGVSLKF